MGDPVSVSECERSEGSFSRKGIGGGRDEENNTGIDGGAGIILGL
jgi:hypothetical protein